MNRDLYKTLVEWRMSLIRKPLLMKGARQTGKTWLLKEFGKREFNNLVYCNFEEETSYEPMLAKAPSSVTRTHRMRAESSSSNRASGNAAREFP
jgi:predicted AAA+ superfamily ATPase